jgi:hypothetical protein
VDVKKPDRFRAAETLQRGAEITKSKSVGIIARIDSVESEAGAPG